MKYTFILLYTQAKLGRSSDIRKICPEVGRIMAWAGLSSWWESGSWMDVAVQTHSPTDHRDGYSFAWALAPATEGPET